MNILKIDLENCYGIKKFQEQFDFSQKKVYAIYAPNGSMKTSLAHTLERYISVILGAPIYLFRLHKEALRFISNLLLVPKSA